MGFEINRITTKINRKLHFNVLAVVGSIIAAGTITVLPVIRYIFAITVLHLVKITLILQRNPLLKVSWCSVAVGIGGLVMNMECVARDMTFSSCEW